MDRYLIYNKNSIKMQFSVLTRYHANATITISLIQMGVAMKCKYRGVRGVDFAEKDYVKSVGMFFAAYSLLISLSRRFCEMCSTMSNNMENISSLSLKDKFLTSAFFLGTAFLVICVVSIYAAFAFAVGCFFATQQGVYS